jgi:hypothetical protein
MSKLRMHGTIFPLPHTSSRPGTRLRTGSSRFSSTPSGNSSYLFVVAGLVEVVAVVINSYNIVSILYFV